MANSDAAGIGLCMLRNAKAGHPGVRAVLYDQDSAGLCMPSDSRASGFAYARWRCGDAGKADPVACINES